MRRAFVAPLSNVGAIVMLLLLVLHIPSALAVVCQVYAHRWCTQIKPEVTVANIRE